MIFKLFFFSHSVDTLKQRLENLCTNKKSNLSSFKKFFVKGLSSQESVTINSIKRIVFNHYKSLFDFVSKNAEGWEKYGEYSNNNFEFFPSRLVTPLRSQLKFQEIMVHTQLFQTFVEERRNCFNNNDITSTSALQIAHWCQRKWREACNRRKMTLLDTFARGLTRNNPAGQKSKKPNQTIKGLKSVLSMTWKQPP